MKSAWLFHHHNRFSAVFKRPPNHANPSEVYPHAGPPCRPVSFRQIDCTNGGSITLFERRNVFGTRAERLTVKNEAQVPKVWSYSSVKQKIGIK